MVGTTEGTWTETAEGGMLVGVVGLGLIGGSLARRLVARGARVVAWNHRPHPYREAEADGIVCIGTLDALVETKPDVIVLCNPLKAMPDVLARIKPALDAAGPHTTLTDVGSVKGMVRAQVEAAGLGGRYVGAHPMAGNELSGWKAADPSLYDDALWAVTVAPDTDFRRFLAVARLVTEGVGDRMIVLDDDTHDRAAALISHMPHVVATAMIDTLVDDPDRNIAAALAAGSWRDMTRVALTDPDRTRAMVEEDAANVERLLRDVASRLLRVANLLHDELDERDVAIREQARADMLGFFAAGQPFRDHKARQRAVADGLLDEAQAYAHRRLRYDQARWREELLASARRGEHVVAFGAPGTAQVELRSRV